MKQILFVDDQPELLDGLRRVLRPQRSLWRMRFATSGPEALEILASEPFDVIVSDMRMPIMDGAQLLNEVMRRSPQTIRIMLSGQADEEQMMRAVGPVHQYLSKPCAPEVLTNTITRACALRNHLREPELLALVSATTQLPAVPLVYRQLVEHLQSSDVSMKKVGELISRDLAISCRLLQLVNSCFFGWSSRIECPVHAANLIGLDRLRALVLSAGVFSQFEGVLPAHLSLEDLMQRSLATGIAAKRLMTLECPKDPAAANDAMLAGIVMDVGHLILLQNQSEQYQRLLDSACRDGERIWESEYRDYRVTHAQLGAYLIGLWGLPDAVVEAVAFHHTPGHCADRNFNLVTAVHVADSLVRELAPYSRWPFGGVLDAAYLQSLGVQDRVGRWQEQISSILAGTAAT